MGIEEGTFWDEHWVLYGNQFDNKFHIYKKKSKFCLVNIDTEQKDLGDIKKYLRAEITEHSFPLLGQPVKEKGIFFFEIYCQIGFHTTPSAHPKRCPLQYPSPTLPPSHPHQSSVFSQFLRVSYIYIPFINKKW